MSKETVIKTKEDTRPAHPARLIYNLLVDTYNELATDMTFVEWITGRYQDRHMRHMVLTVYESVNNKVPSARISSGGAYSRHSMYSEKNK
jgi:hypothetical protein